MSSQPPTIADVSIIGYSLVPPDQLFAAPLNARRHPNAQRDALRASLRSLGWIAPVVVNRTSGHVLDGHARIEEALSADVPLVPVVEVELTPEQEALALATFDPIGNMAQFDRQALDDLLREVDTGESALQQLLSDLAESVGIAVPAFAPVGIDEQGRLDEKARVTCPECGHEFTP
jgi:ParB-like chromosome segregation protein Spo0J